MYYSHILTVKEGEAYDLLQAMVWIVELSLDDVIFELDGKVPMDKFNNFSRNSSYFRFIINIVFLVLNNYVQTQF